MQQFMFESLYEFYIAAFNAAKTDTLRDLSVSVVVFLISIGEGGAEPKRSNAPPPTRLLTTDYIHR